MNFLKKIKLAGTKFFDSYDELLNHFLILLIIAQGLSVFLINLFQTETYLFFDNAVAIRHGVEMWRNGLFLEGYNYFSTLEIDNAGFFAIPLYFLTGNLGLSLGIVHVLLYALCVYLIYSLFKNGGYDTKYGLIATFLLFTPFVIGALDWGNMIFLTVGQYEFRIIVMISVTNLLLMVLNTQVNKRNFIVLLVLNTVLCFWTSLSCGNYVLLMILLPFCLFFIYINCISDKLVINKSAVLILLTSVISALIAIVIRDAAIGETSRSNIPLLTADTFTANLLNCITGFFMLFGGLTQDALVPIFTAKGILRIIKFVLISTCLVLVFMKLKKMKKNDYLPYMFFFIALVNLAVMILTVTRYGALIFEYRYHIIWGAMLLLAAVAAIESIEYVRLKKLVLFGIVLMALIINLGGYNAIFQKVPTNVFEHEIIEFADENDIDTIYLYNMPSEAAAIRVLDLEKSCMSVYYYDDKIYSITDNYYEDYSSYYTYDERHLFICSPENFELLPDEMKACYPELIILENGCAYIGSENPWLE